MTAMTNRVNFTVSHYGSSRYVATPVAHWDVINEMVNQGTVSHEFYMEHTGDPLIRWQYKTSFQIIPGQKCSSWPRASPRTPCCSSTTTESSWIGGNQCGNHCEKHCGNHCGNSCGNHCLCSIFIPQKWPVCTFPTANKRSSGPGCPD